jgi:deoxycytidylate deaminase
VANPAAEVRTDRPEIVFGLVGAVGTDLALTADLLGDVLRTFGYHVVDTISLSQLLDYVERENPLPTRSDPYDVYIDERMTAGDELRAGLRSGSALAQMAVHEVLLRRGAALADRGGEEQPGNMAYVLRSLKHEEEVEALRKLYGPRFTVIGAHAPRGLRTEELAAQIASSRASTDRAKYRQHAERLAHRDEAEEDDDYGQHVRETFPLADFFIDVSQRHGAKRNLERFVYAFFGWPFASPSRDEYAMFHAQAASARSADLSRQVGASIATVEGDIIAVGCNEVPRFGGGAYWENDAGDARDFQRGEDANQHMRDVIVKEIQDVLSQEWLAPNRKGASLEDFRDALGDARVQQLTEFNRAAHAEMAALLDAARRGVSVRGATLYTTTFPCHNCAKHVVAAGITRVVYIAPYAKSLAEDLHPDSIAIDHGHPVEGKVAFDPFVGVAPDIYLPLFTKGDIRRKERATGKIVDFDPLAANLKLVPEGDFAYLDREQLALRALHDALIANQERATGGGGEAVKLSPARMASLQELAADEPPDASGKSEADKTET